MVRTMLYCSEQISIPETFPNILKSYAKAAIRTQPYDLLRWSAAYFRCLANDVPPPVKIRLEKECQQGSLTKGYLRVLLDQVGKGYFISRRLLQKRWAALCLPEEELLKYLSVCRMLNWPQVHWLKLFAVMVGSLNETLLGTLNMICELLTDDVEGGRARIPIWMFRVCYTFVAELDCSEEQHFVNGRKKLPSGDLEEERRMGKIPQVFSASSIRQAIFDKCIQRYNTECTCHEGDILHQEIITGRSNGCPLHSSVSLPSGFQFADTSDEPTEVLRKYHDFDSLILLLREAQGAVLHQYGGPFKVTQKHIQHSKAREEEILAAKARQAEIYEDNAKKYMYQEKIHLLREVGPPWTWLHQFAADSCMDKSYNFIEDESIISDITPSDSSDESFDFCKGKPTYNDEGMTPSSTTRSSSDNVSELMNEKSSDENEICKDSEPFEIIRSFLKDAENKGEIDSKNTSSVTDFLCKEEYGVLKGAGRKAVSGVDVENVIQALRAADRNGIQFETIDEIVDYLKQQDEKLKGYFISQHTVPKEDGPEKSESSTESSAKVLSIEKYGVVEEKRDSAKRISDLKAKERKISKEKEGAKVKEEKSDSSLSEQTGETSTSYEQPEEELAAEEEGTIEELSKPQQIASFEEKPEESEEIDKEAEEGSIKSKASLDSSREDNEISQDYPITTDTVYAPIDVIREEEERLPMTQVFADSGTLPEDLKLGPEGSCVILGLVDKEEAEEEEISEEEKHSTITPSGTVSGCGALADHSSKYIYSERSDDSAKKRFQTYTCAHSESSDSLCSVSEGFSCTIPAYPGIGPVVSKKTIQDFLTYLKMRSRSQKGMIMPSNFKEEKCPRFMDNYCL